MVETAVARQKVKSSAVTQTYLVDLLEQNMINGKIESNTTLAEMYLTASSAEPAVKVELLKRLGDTALYVSGFFGDSLHRKLVDIDYYAEMGETAYGTLAQVVNIKEKVPVFNELSSQFLAFVDVLTFISQQAMVQSDGDLLRLYNRYLATGSKLAEEQLLEKGVLASPLLTKASRQ